MKNLIVILFFNIPFLLAAQIRTGINTKTPLTTLHVKPQGTDDPLVVEGLKEGTVLDKIVVADKNGVLKQVKAAIPKFFYAPATIIPTHNTTGAAAGTILNGPQTVNLYTIYTNQFSMSEVTSQARSNPSSTLPTLNANELDYFITYYDKDVFDEVKISDVGLLTYKVKTNALATAKTFFNIVFKVKD